MTKKATSLADFNELSQQQQYDLLHSEGVFVGKRKHGKQTIVLFQLFGFYVEVFYKAYRKEIEVIHTSADTSILTQYIDQVHVRDLKKDKPTD